MEAINNNMSVEAFYSGRSVFVTGASGFIGKVLIEKLLRSCPSIGNIYMLIRPGKDNKSANDRLREDFSKSRVFTKAKVPLALNKLVAISGDLTEAGLGIATEDRQTLIDNVSVVFHSAATVRFHGPMNDFVKQNVLGTDEIMQLASEMKHLRSVVYVSTAYANCNLLEIDEKVYGLPKPAQKMVDEILAANSSEAPKIGDADLYGRPNSYTLSKAIAESLVSEKYPDLPVVICRPSIVTHAYTEPMQGWCDSLNGLAGTLLLGGLGIARTMEMNCDCRADIIPVDFVANSLIVVGWYRGTYERPNTSSSAAATEAVKVVHLTSGEDNPISWGEILNFARQSALRQPSIKLIRPIAQNPISSKGVLGKANHLLVKFFSHFIFAVLFDTMLTLLGQKRFMMKVTRKMHRAFDVLEHFTNHQWVFRYEHYNQIYESLTPADQQCYPSKIASIDWIQYCDSLYMGSRRYLLNEEDSTIPRGVRRQRFLTIGYAAFKTLMFGWLSWTAFQWTKSILFL